MDVLFKTKAIFTDGEVIEDTVTNQNFNTVREVEDAFKREFGKDLASILVTDMRRCRRMESKGWTNGKRV